eukprot:scaffold1350_cov507-Pavlova_lutheri.AAC.1
MSSLDEEGREERWEALERNLEEERSRREGLEEKLAELQELLQAKQASPPDDLKTATDGLTLPEVKGKPSASEEQPVPSHTPCYKASVEDVGHTVGTWDPRLSTWREGTLRFRWVLSRTANAFSTPLLPEGGLVHDLFHASSGVLMVR